MDATAHGRPAASGLCTFVPDRRPVNETMLAAAHGIHAPLDDAIARAVISDVARAHCLTEAAIVGRSRRRDVALARAETVHRLWSDTKLSLNAIGALLGGRDHSTISYLIASHAVRTASGIR